MNKELLLELFSYVAIISILLTGIIPIVALMVHYIKKNKQLDRDRELEKAKKAV